MDVFRRFELGDKVLLKNDDGEYEGVIKKLTRNADSIVLTEAKNHSTQEPMLGLQTFFGAELISCELLHSGSNTIKSNKKRNANVELPPIPFGVKQKDNLDDDKFSSSEEEEEEEDESRLTEGPIQWDEIIGAENRATVQGNIPTKFLVVDELNSQFYESVKTIKAEKTVGVGLEGESINRFGALYWLTVSAKDCVYFFDILRLKKSAFDKGLREILESKEPTKVFHDCKLVSDLLFHQYSVKLAEGVVDTEAADVVNLLKGTKNQILPEKYRSQKQCLQYYLHFYIFPVAPVNSSKWKIRPLTLDVRNTALQNVAFLCPLWEALLRALHRELTLAVNINLTLIRDSIEEDLPLKMGKPGTLPDEMNYLVSKKSHILFHLDTLNKEMEQEYICKRQQLKEKLKKQNEKYLSNMSREPSKGTSVPSASRVSQTTKVRATQSTYRAQIKDGTREVRPVNQQQSGVEAIIQLLRKKSSAARIDSEGNTSSSSQDEPTSPSSNSRQESSIDESGSSRSIDESLPTAYAIPKFAQKLIRTNYKMMPAGSEF